MEEHIKIDIDSTYMNGPIENETDAIKYTDEHFMNKLFQVRMDSVHKMSDLDGFGEMNEDPTIQQFRFTNHSNSPIFMSNNNSDSDGDGDLENDIPYMSFDSPALVVKKNQPRRLTFRQVRDSIHKYYESDEKYSDELDILTCYLKCQKQLYIVAMNITQFRLQMIGIPAFICSVSVSIFAPFLYNCRLGGFLVSIINACAVLLYFSIYYFRLLPSMQSYFYISKQYDKLGNSIDYIDKTREKSADMIFEIVKEMEKKFADVKEMIPSDIPFDIKYMFPVLYNIPIFSFIKRMEIYKKNLIVKFKDIKNETLYIEWKWGDDMGSKEKNRLEFLYKIKDKIRDQIIHYNNAYACMEELLTREIKNGENCSFLWRNPIFLSNNPAVRMYLLAIFADDSRISANTKAYHKPD